MVMTAMRLGTLRQVDLNLLIAFAAIAEEKRYGCCTPAVTEPACCKPSTPARTRLSAEVGGV
jgi:hypothetical protein